MDKVWKGLALGLSLATFLTGCDGGGESTGGAGGSTGGSGGAEGGSGGSGGGGTGGGATTKSVAINFEARVGEEVFDCTKTFAGLGTTAADAKISDFRVYVHDVELLFDGGSVPVTLEQDGVWQYENVALLDFESGSGSCANGTAELRDVITGTIPVPSGDAVQAELTGVRFKVGVPFELNHGDVATAPSPLNLSALFWNWNGGYKFLRIDSVPMGAAMSFNLHLGSTECQDDGGGGVSACNKPNRPTVELNGKDPLVTKVLVDYAAVVAGADLSMNAGGAPGCMSGAADPECGPIFEKLGLDIGTGAPTSGQELFSFDPAAP